MDHSYDFQPDMRVMQAVQSSCPQRVFLHVGKHCGLDLLSMAATG